MRTRDGFALLAVLWVLVAVTALAGAALAVARTGSAATRNRILLARAAWAREACLAIVEARYARNPAFRALDTVDLGRGTWCTATLDDPTARLNINTTDTSALRALFRSVGIGSLAVDSMVAEADDARPLSATAALRDLPAFTSQRVAAVDAFITTRGPGVVNVNAASPTVLATLPGIGADALWTITAARAVHSISSADELASRLGGASRHRFDAAYQAFVRSAVFAPPVLIERAVGGVRQSPLTAAATLTVVPVEGRLAVVRRESE
ncbi:MAG TPA: hypothetical protein VFD85_15430 [Gemmatimonadales bacterium]|nr:hypothetical protein [Gemmatimonadales bacterium]